MLCQPSVLLVNKVVYYVYDSARISVLCWWMIIRGRPNFSLFFNIIHFGFPCSGYKKCLVLTINLQEQCVLYIGRAYRYLPDVAFYVFFSTNISTEYFKHTAHSWVFSSKCRLFYNATFFGSCIIHILHTGVLKFKCKTLMPKG
jgi:hypothetical protein